MKRSALKLFVVLLLGGCAESVDEAEMVNDESSAANAAVATETPAAQPAAAVSVSDTAEEASSVDAERLLASTLEKAKAENKRVMVHLGAPW